MVSAARRDSLMSMAIKTLLAPDEYLTTSFDNPEPEYVNGELVERSVPNFSHARTQTLLGDAFRPWDERNQLFRATEIRFPVAPDRFRVADFAVFLSEQADLPGDKPYAIVEIVSPDDRHEDLIGKLRDYEKAGIEFIFVADPPFRSISRFRLGDLLSVSSIDLPRYGVSIPAETIFH